MSTQRAMQPPEDQPLGFWTVRAGEAIGARTRGALRDIGLSQPEWWLLQQVSLDPDGVDRDATIEKIGHNSTPEAIVEAIDSAVAKGWVQQTDSRLKSTSLGTGLFERAAALQQELQTERMQGNSIEDFATTIRVLQQTIDNVGGEAWHW
ncbi:MAG: hypothetical protein WBD41_04035 [Rhodococcus sp. (in: high G+C Gram-positive bacteria)]